MRHFEVIAYVDVDDTFCVDCGDPRLAPVFAGDEDFAAGSRCADCGCLWNPEVSEWEFDQNRWVREQTARVLGRSHP